MATINIVGFEAGDATEASQSSGTFSVQGTIKRSGQYALRCNPAASAAGAFRIQSYAATAAIAAIGRTAETFYTFYFRFEDLPAANVHFVQVVATAGTIVARLRCSSGGLIVGVGSTTSATVATIAADTWYRADLRVTSNGTSGLTIDGGTEQTFTAANATMDWFICGRHLTSEAVAFDCYYDDVFISDTAFPGAGQVNRLDPDSGPRTYATWANGTGTTNTHVDDDVPGHDSDTTYWGASALDDNLANTVALESCASGGVVGTILSVLHYAICRADSVSGTSAVGLRVRNNATNVDTATLAEWTTTYATKGMILDTDPNGGGAWTSGGLDTLEIGVVAGTLAQAQRCTKVAAMVWSNGVAPAGKAPPLLQRATQRWTMRRQG